MKLPPLLIAAFLFFLIPPKAAAQTCSPWLGVKLFKGSYTLSAQGSGPTSSGTYTLNHTMQASFVIFQIAGPCTSTQVFWVGSDSSSQGSVNDSLVANNCNPGSQSATIVGSGSNLSSAVELILDPSTGTFSFSEPGFSIAATESGVDCKGNPVSLAVNWNIAPAPSWPSFPLPGSVQTLTQSTTFQALGAPGPLTPLTWNLTLTLTPLSDNQDDQCSEEGGSSVACQNQSLGEDVPIVGTGFQLHYESDRASGRAAANSVASAYAKMLGGWTLNVHHAYDPANNTLFLGDGSQRSAWQLGSAVMYGANSLVTSADGSEVYLFDGKGRHLQTLNPLTGALKYEFTYDTAGNLSGVTDSNGNVTNILRDGSGHPTDIVSPYSQTTTLTVDGNGFLSSIRDPAGHTQTFTNSSAGLLSARTDANGNLYSYQYDSFGRLTLDSSPAGGSVSLSRTDNSSGYQVVGTTAMGRTTTYNVTLSQIPGEQLTTVWPDGLTATVVNSQQGGELQEATTLPDGSSYKATFSPDPIWGIQAPVATSQTLTRGNLTMNVSGSRASFGTAGNPFSLISQTDTATINGRTYTSAFTASNRTIVNTTPVGRKRTAVLDNQERISRLQIEGLLASDFGYDLRGRLLAVTQGTRKRTFTYDSDGRLATATDPLGLKNSFSYDADGRLLSATLPDGRIIGYQYDANGNLTAVIPPGKSAHNFTYTAVNEVSQYQPPSVAGTGSTTYSYNTDRDLTQITRPDSQTISFGYDNAGRLSSLTTPSETVDYTYDSTTGNLTAASVTGGEALSYGYNGPLPTSSSWTGTVNGSVGLAYNDNFWVTSKTINGGNTIAFSYDNDGLVTNAGALTLNRSPFNGLISGTTLGPASDSRTYNSFGELTGYAASYNGVGLYGLSYTRDADGRVSRETETIGGHTNTYAYSYDHAGRLVGVSQNGSAVSSYSYDSNSNRIGATTTSGTVSATYDAQDRLLSYGPATYTYTANGELASQTLGTQKTAYQYDVLGNLISVTLPNGTAISYVVDARNRRVGKKVNGALVAGFLYDGDRIVAQLNGSNALVSQFIYASGATSPDYMVSGGATYRIFSDQLGSPRIVVNTSTGAVAEQITYNEFGNVLSDSNPGFQPFGFAGGLYDQDTKLVRFGARDYNPSVGRWTAKDPILFAGGDTNLYGYVLNDPLNLIDPSGWAGSTVDQLMEAVYQYYLKYGDTLDKGQALVTDAEAKAATTVVNGCSKVSKGFIQPGISFLGNSLKGLAWAIGGMLANWNLNKCPKYQACQDQNNSA